MKGLDALLAPLCEYSTSESVQKKIFDNKGGET